MDNTPTIIPYIRFEKGGLIAPNGKPSNLTPEQYKLVRTNEFKAWFGDWEYNPSEASKVVDENGEPNMCFHATNNDFNVFDERYIGSANDRGFYGKGFYFTFQSEFKDINYAINEALYYGGKLLNCYIKALNPFDISILSMYKNKRINYIGAESLVFLTNISILFPQIADKIFIEKNTWNKFTQEYDVEELPISILPNLVNKYANDLKLIDTDGQFDRKETMGYVKSELVKYEYTDKDGKQVADQYVSYDDLGRVQREISKEEKEILFIEKAIEKYEGISIRFRPEGYMTRNSIITDAIKEKHDCILQSKFGDELVVFQPNQIKLADGTNTTFDGSNNDIRFKKGGMTNKGYVSYKDKYNTKYGYADNESHDLNEISKDTGVSMKGLQQIYNKGIGAYKNNPQSVRPNVKSKEQWAMARVYSSVMGGKASKIDSNELKMNLGGLVGDIYIDIMYRVILSTETTTDVYETSTDLDEITNDYNNVSPSDFDNPNSKFNQKYLEKIVNKYRFYVMGSDLDPKDYIDDLEDTDYWTLYYEDSNYIKSDSVNRINELTNLMIDRIQEFVKQEYNIGGRYAEKYMTISIDNENGEFINDLNIRIADHSQNTRNNDSNSFNLSFVISNLNATQNRFLPLGTEYYFDDNIDIENLKNEIKGIIDEKIEEIMENREKFNGGGVTDSEINEILQYLERSYLQGTRGLNLNVDKEQTENPRFSKETLEKGQFGRLYQYLKKYDIFGGYNIIWVGDLEKINNFKSKIKELKSNGYSVIQKISAITKDKTKHFRFIAVKKKLNNGDVSVGEKEKTQNLIDDLNSALPFLDKEDQEETKKLIDDLKEIMDFTNDNDDIEIKKFVGGGGVDLKRNLTRLEVEAMQRAIQDPLLSDKLKESFKKVLASRKIDDNTDLTQLKEGKFIDTYNFSGYDYSADKNEKMGVSFFLTGEYELVSKSIFEKDYAMWLFYNYLGRINISFSNCKLWIKQAQEHLKNEMPIPIGLLHTPYAKDGRSYALWYACGLGGKNKAESKYGFKLNWSYKNNFYVNEIGMVGNYDYKKGDGWGTFYTERKTGLLLPEYTETSFHFTTLIHEFAHCFDFQSQLLKNIEKFEKIELTKSEKELEKYEPNELEKQLYGNSLIEKENSITNPITNHFDFFIDSLIKILRVCASGKIPLTQNFEQQALDVQTALGGLYGDLLIDQREKKRVNEIETKKIDEVRNNERFTWQGTYVNEIIYYIQKNAIQKTIIDSFSKKGQKKQFTLPEIIELDNLLTNYVNGEFRIFMTSYPSKVTALYEKIKDYKIEINRIINNHYDNIRRNFEYGFYPKNDLEIYLFENCKLEDFRDYKSWKDCNKTKLSEIK